MIKVKPYLSSETNSGWGFGGNESKTVQSLWHLEVLTHQVKNESLVNVIACLWSGYLEHQSSTVLIFWMFPTGFHTNLEKFNRVYFSWSLIHKITMLINVNTYKLFHLLCWNNWKGVRLENASRDTLSLRELWL